MRTFEIIVDVVESHVLTIKANTKDKAEELAEIDGCEGEPDHTEVKVRSTKEL
jgi:hypothetical protein